MTKSLISNGIRSKFDAFQNLTYLANTRTLDLKQISCKAVMAQSHSIFNEVNKVVKCHFVPLDTADI